MRRQNGSRCDLLVAEEPVRRFELRVVEQLRKALLGPLRERLGEEAEPPTQPGIAQVGVSEFSGKARGIRMFRLHLGRGSHLPIPGNTYTPVFDDFDRALRTGTEPRFPGEEGAKSTAIIHAIQVSARTGQRVRL